MVLGVSAAIVTCGCLSLHRGASGAECPNGHKTLRLASIEYGMVLETPELAWRLAHKRTLLGGCVVGSKGDFGVICTTCGCYTFHGEAVWYDEKGDAMAIRGTREKEAR
jgi:hypothetical protein